MNRARTLLLSLAFSSSTLLAEPLSLEQVVTSVEERYPLLEAAERDVEAAEGEVLAAEGAFDLLWKNRASVVGLGYYDNFRWDSVIEKPLAPWGASVFAGYRRGTGTFPIYDDKAVTLSRGEARFGFDVSLWRNRATDRRRTNLEKAQWTLTANEAAALQARLEAVRNATMRYWDWVAAGNKVVVFRNLLRIAEERDQALLQRVEHGDLPDFERKDNERTILQRRSQLVSADRVLQQAAIELSLFLRDESGVPVTPPESKLPTKIPMEDAVFDATLSSDVEGALRRRPELARLAATRQQAQLEGDWADDQLAPRVDLQMVGSRDMGSGSTTRRGTELEAALAVEIPLERRLATGRRQSARATQERVAALEQMTRDRIEADIRDAHSVLKAAVLRRTIALEESELARKLEEGERIRFSHGDSNVLFVNLREQASADALVREVDARADYQKGLAQRKAAAGEL